MWSSTAKKIKDLSPQIQKEVAYQIDKGERVSALVQATLILFLFFVWLIAPKADDAVQSFEAIPIVLMFYVPVLALRVYWSFKGGIHETTSFLITIIDISAITILIFLYHIQYDVVPSASLKSPTFLFLIVVIATRSLSLRPSLVALSTGLAVFFWFVLTFYTLQHPETSITNSFVEYTSSGKVLIGAEVEKILALLAVGLVLVFGVKGTLAMLVRGVEATEHRKSLSMFFSQEVSELIASGKISFQPGKGEKRLAAVLFVDLRGFTKLSQEVSPDETLKILSEYHQFIVPIINRNGGTVDKFLGDGILAHYGAVVPSATYAADVVKTIEESIVAIRKWNEQRQSQGLKPLVLNYAATEGLVVFGATGESKRLEMTIIGEPVNLAAKLEKFNKELGADACMTTKLIHQAKDQNYELQIETKVANQQSVPGTQEPIDVCYIPQTGAEALKRAI